MFSGPYFESINEDYIRFSIIFCDGHLHYNFTKVAHTYFCQLITGRFRQNFQNNYDFITDNLYWIILSEEMG